MRRKCASEGECAMNIGLLPPIPDLIPISVLRKRPPPNGNSDGNSYGGPPECAPECSEVMGEQRPRRRSANHPAVELIDSAGSRGSSAAPQASLSRKARPERHRKSDRRRERRNLTRTRSTSKHSKSPFPQNPRVNPIFVWVRQEDTRIVDVKCEDYDKRNRILLTKTAQGWRATPRTETLVPTLKEADRDQYLHHHHHRNKKSRKAKVRRRSTGVQVSSDIDQDDEEPPPEEQPAKFEDPEPEPPWISSDNINVESLLPSHTIKVKRSTSPNHSPERDSNVNSGVSDSAQTPTIKCSADKICDVSPLDNLLAVAELEFKQQIQSEEWNKTTQSDPMPNEDAIVTFNDFDQTEDDQEFMKNLETLNNLIDSEKSKLEFSKDVDLLQPKTEECDYNDDEDPNLAMDDILSRLEQSLRSPECMETNICDISSLNKNEENIKVNFDCDNETDLKSVPEFENFFEENHPKSEEQKVETDVESIKPEIINLVESSTNDDDEDDEIPTDLSIKLNNSTLHRAISINTTEEPTDLSIPKSVSSPRPLSQNSEAIQSPQPSGIPAVPQSPDIVSTTVNVSNKTKSVFLESLLTNCTKKMQLNSEVTITPQREPLDLGKCRKSASPTVTCSEEINSSLTPSEPPTKKIKSVDITLKTLLDADLQKTNSESKTSEKAFTSETPKLLELLQNETEPDPLVQLKQLLADPTQDVPDPLLVPKERFSQILIHPGTEIPKLLKERPELRLPHALAFPHIMQDPNMLVINVHHLESILSNRNSVTSTNKACSESKNDKHEKSSEKSLTETNRQSPVSTKKKASENATKTNSIENQAKAFNELANDINTATQAAFNQMSWFPYINHIEAMALTNNPEFVKMLNSMHLPMYMNQMPELFSNMRPPVSPMGFPMAPPMNYSNPLEFNMWQEAMLQAQVLRNKSFENHNNDQNVFKNYFDNMNAQSNRSMMSNNCMNPRVQTSNKQGNYSNQYYKSDHSSYQNPYSNYNSYGNKTAHQNMPSQANHQKHSMNHKNHGGHFSSKGSSSFPPQNFAHLYSQMSDMEKHQYMQNVGMSSQDPFHQNFPNMMRKETNVSQKAKANCKNFTNSSQRSSHSHQEHHKERNHPTGSDVAKVQTTQPMDLSGSTPSGGKLKVKQHLIDPANTPKLLKHHDDIPEVGSTTASIEEMQDAHKHLWHPLFGNEKGYTSPWNWTTVTATGE